MGGCQYALLSRTAYGSTPRRRSPRPRRRSSCSVRCNYGRAGAAREHLAAQNRLLEQFQTPGLQEWLTRDPDFLLAPVRQNAAVVFVDLSGFTSLSETLDPDATRGLLKEFHALVDKEVTRCGGMITSFLGDGAMILFWPAGGGSRMTPRARRNVRSRSASRPNAGSRRCRRQSLIVIGFKIGAHFGPIVASRLGGRNHQHITATGDTVNVASRLMEVAARHDVRLAVSDTLRIAAERIGARLKTGSLAGPVETQICGRSGSLTVWLWRGEHPHDGSTARIPTPRSDRPRALLQFRRRRAVEHLARSALPADRSA